MKDEKTIEAYDKMADDYRTRNSNPFYTEEYDAFSKFFGEKKKILEIGCGIGRDAEELKKRGFTYTGIDASWRMLAFARERIPMSDFRRMDFYAMDFPDGSFDGFWASAAFLHAPKNEVNKALLETKRILVPHGVGFISMKEKTTMDEGAIHEEKAGGIDRYFSFYTEEEFRAILEESGFEILDAHKKEENDPAHTVWLCFFVKKKE